MKISHKHQAMLVAVAIRPPAVVLAAEGDELLEEVDASGPFLEDLGWDPDDFPDERGLHAWEGTLHIYHGADGFVTWEGTWRRATAADLGRFGLTLDPSEDGTHA